MSTAAKAHEPTMEEILASIRRIISDDEPGQPMAPKPSTAKAAPAAEPAPAPPPAMDAEDAASALGQDDIDAMFASFDAPAPAPAKAEPAVAKAPPEPAPAPVAPAADDLDVFDLTEDMAEDVSPPPPQPAPIVAKKAEPQPEDEADWGIPAPEREAPAPQAAAIPSAPAFSAPMSSGHMSSGHMSSGHMEDRLLSGATNEAVTGAFGALANTILANNARTLDDLVKDMLRPMLREWLDDNLPPMVERLVKQEIERVARGGR